jgi:hypothetical protein
LLLVTNNISSLELTPLSEKSNCVAMPDLFIFATTVLLPFFRQSS